MIVWEAFWTVNMIFVKPTRAAQKKISAGRASSTITIYGQDPIGGEIVVEWDWHEKVGVTPTLKFDPLNDPNINDPFNDLFDVIQHHE